MEAGDEQRAVGEGRGMVLMDTEPKETGMGRAGAWLRLSGAPLSSPVKWGQLLSCGDAVE